MGGMKTVLLSPIGAKAMPGIIEYWNGKGYEVIGIDADGQNNNRFMVRAFMEVPPVGGPRYKGDVLDIIRHFNVKLFISWLDAEIRFWNVDVLDDFRDVFAMNFRPDLMGFYDKWTFSELLNLYDFPHPKTRLLRGPGSWERLKLPVIFKPRIGTGSRGIYVVHNSDEYDYWSRVIHLSNKNESYLAQSFIAGNEYTVDLFADNGKLVNHAIRLRVKPNGVSMGGRIVRDGDITEIVKRFCKEFTIDGLNNIQLIEDIEEHYFITDFNPRPSGTIMLSVTAGVDLFQNLIEKHEGKPLTKFGRPKPLNMVRYMKEFYYA